MVVIFLFTSAQVWMNWWWYSDLGYGNVLLRRALLKVAAFVFVTLLGALVVGGSAVYAFRKTRRTDPRNTVVRAIDRFLFWIVLAASLGTGVVLAWWTANQWEIFALWWNGRSLGIEDPVFHRDASFYLFALPAIELIWRILGAAVLVALAVTALVYLIRLGLNLRHLGSLPSTALRHLLVLGGIILILGGAWFWIENYRLVYSTRGSAYGVSYVDDHAIRIGNWAAAVLLVVAGVACFAIRRIPARREIFIVAIVLVAFTIAVNGLLPLFVQNTIVNPDELNKERPYIENNLAMTTFAYGLTNITEGELSGQGDITLPMIDQNPELLSNVRLWDYRVAQTTFQEVTSFAGYYSYVDVDTDRYLHDGSTDQVLIAAREMNQAGLPDNAQTWTNQRLVYTHGYGIVVSPVDRATSSGLPVYYVSQIPPDGVAPYEITYPEIYYGEADLGWVIVGSKQPEFSALPDVDSTTSLTQDAIVGGIRTDDMLTKLISAIALKDRNVFLSGNITNQSTLLLHRNITDRIKEIAPFLTLDEDPYLVIADGRLVWVVDAYTTSDRFPMATPQEGINYIRSSVKVTIDALTGETIFYRTAEVDPVADAYGRMFPTLFTPIAEAPPSVSAHFRYPETLYNIQSRIYGSIHVGDPDQYYNGEDKWAIPGSLVSESLLEDQSDRDEMPAYFLTLPLPSEVSADFTLVRPFVPGGNSQRKNMTAWMAGRANPDGSLRLYVYRFPRQTTVFGPQQVEARIDQDPTIVQQLALWNQSGSEVLQGNLMIIPVNETVIYIQPLYLRSTGGSSIPELQRVIVATQTEVYMGESLEQALAGALSPGEVAPPPLEGGPEGEPSTDVAVLVQQANDAYERGQAALAAGNWAEYGKAQDDLAAILAQLETITGTPTAAPQVTPEATPTT
jgi:uncharacterized membrane protein (UPF0182 family)